MTLSQEKTMLHKPFYYSGVMFKVHLWVQNKAGKE